MVIWPTLARTTSVLMSELISEKELSMDIADLASDAFDASCPVTENHGAIA